MEGKREMRIEIISENSTKSVEAQEGQTALAVLQQEGIPFSAPCGGNGTCGKCKALIKNSEGLEYRLACQTPAEDGMQIIIEKDKGMRIQVGGFSSAYDRDADPEGGYGLAIDVGTTTVVCHLHDLSTGERIASASSPNPQAVFGGDVLSRINASMEGKLPAMNNVIISCLATLSRQAFETAGIHYETPRKAVLAGNTVMEHIAANLSPDSIGVNPFTPLSLFGDSHNIEGLCPNTYFVDCVAGYVGGDITAGILASELHKKEKPCVFLDIGTNGEMAIGCKDRIITCATAAGPAFEGANITFGMPAAPGGISKLEVGDDGFELNVIGGIAPVGICGSGLIDALAAMLNLEVVDEGGALADPDEVDGFAADLLDEVDDKDVFFLTENRNVYITQKDIRNLQLAKAAICAGILTLCDEYGIEVEDIDEMLIAGGFGNFIRLESAARMGLFPPVLLDRAKSIGNSAGEGASDLLVSKQAREDFIEVVKKCEYLELSTSAGFNEHYVDQMSFEEE